MIFIAVNHEVITITQFDEYLIFIQKMKDFVTNRSLRMLDSQKNYV